MFKKSILILLLILLGACSILRQKTVPKVEFRGVWVATVANIDWPKNGNDPIEKQKKDFLSILDFYQKLNFNAVIVQIRTAGDAFYSTQLAPWSRFLTGVEGSPPKNGFAPLPWMIKEAHKHGFEFHAWLNPYRATVNLDTTLLSPQHDFFIHPDWMIPYGNKYYYDPGLPEVQQHLVKIMDEIVTNYDVDALHFDDYFYPYKIPGEKFNDSLSYAAYSRPQQSVEDWRRSNVDSLIKKIHETIKNRKPWVQFGISPFGVWKNNSTDPNGSDTKAGQTTYDDLYADPLLWMKQGWIDYIVPQVYWSMDHPAASYHKIVDWWNQNSQNTNLFIGNGVYKIRNNKDKAWSRKKELPKQIALARKEQNVQGNVFFSAKSLMGHHRDVLRYLKRKFYENPALTPPPSPIYGSQIESGASLKAIMATGTGYSLKFDGLKDMEYALLYSFDKKKQTNIKNLIAKIYLNGANGFQISKETVKGQKLISITFLSKYRQETKPITVHLKNYPNDGTKR